MKKKMFEKAKEGLKIPQGFLTDEVFAPSY